MQESEKQMFYAKCNNCENKKECINYVFKPYNENLYFIHGSYSSGEYINRDNNELIRDRLILLKDNTDIEGDYGNDELVYSVEALDIRTPQSYLQGEFFEGQYVYYSKNDGSIRDAEQDPRAIYNKEANQQIVNNIISNRYENYISDYNKYFKDKNDNITNVHSFHINVGHGNCSIIVFKKNTEYEMWMIDCSDYDFLIQQNQAQQLQKCLDDIRIKYNLKTFSKLFITHLHFDHISGIRYLIKNNYVDKRTEVWMNIQYPWAGATYTKILQKLQNLKVKFVDPVIKNSTNNIKIVYPHRSFNQSYPAPNNHINNSSVVYQIVLNGKSMLFPGDIETEGWDQVDCFPFLAKTNYYCISHHGSNNGHIRNKCFLTKSNVNLNYCAANSKVQILMGRDGAYSGIFDTQVLNGFPNICRTDQVPNYLELDWNTGKVSKK